MSEGFDVIHIPDDNGVVEEVIKLKPSLVLLDNDMPVKNGLTLASEIRNIPEAKNILQTSSFTFFNFSFFSPMSSIII